MMDKAIEMIQTIVTDFEEGQIFKGKVVSIKEFGAFVEFAPGKEGMVHISKISKERIDRVEDVLTLGDEVKVVCLGKDKLGRMRSRGSRFPLAHRASYPSISRESSSSFCARLPSVCCEAAISCWGEIQQRLNSSMPSMRLLKNSGFVSTEA